MNWKRLNPDCIQTDTHAICKVKTGVESVKFVVYDRLKTGGFKSFGSYDNSADAKRRCESEAKRKNK